ncbi:hypothetical protein [Saccharospirillum alexandrii]|uniref:hypothetical protein n=1 Tax=Saccharospirillum alexandrii TaxID=2448477 RepID=UPI0037353BE1
MIAKAVWLSRQGCGDSFWRAFVVDPNDDDGRTRYAGSYVSSGGVTLRRIETGGESTIIAGGVHNDDVYERLAKALGGYNQGSPQFSRGQGNSWLNHLIDISNPSSATFVRYSRLEEPSPAQKKYMARSKAMDYAMTIMHDDNKLSLPSRSYIFEGGAYADDLVLENGAPDPRAGQVWCFDYSESHWLAGIGLRARLLAARGDPLALPPIEPTGRVDC